MKNTIIKPIFRVTILCMLLLIFSSITGSSSFQSINVKSFKILENDLDARVNYPKRDQNGEVCAIIKVVTTATGLTFDIGSLGVVATEQKVGEVWVYVPRGAQRITISHQQLGVLRNYAFPESIKSATVYELVLVTADVIVTLKEREIATQWLAVSSTPEGADVFINDKFVGRTPYTGQFPSGEYTYRLELPKYHTEAGVLRLNEKKEVLSFSMRPKFGSINITSFPESGMKIYIDDNLTELTTPATLTGISSGSHTIKLVDDWYKTQSQNVNVLDNTTSIIAFTMDPAYSNITISTNPSADILINNLKKEFGTLKIRMLTGIYSLRVELDKHYPVERQLVVEENKDQSMIINLIPKTGTLNITSTPFDAKIKLNGVDYGFTPMTIKNLLIGSYDLVIEKQGYGTISKSLLIEENKSNDINEILPNGKEVSFISNPNSAQLWIDGVNVGRTPYSTTLGFGDHIVKVVNGKIERTQNIRVTQDVQSKWEFDVSENLKLKVGNSQKYIEFVSIPAGTFTMGSPASEVGRSSNETQHQVTLSAFKMSKYEVTFEQYDLFCDATGRSKPNDEGWGRGNRPVINVSWDNATAFAEWMGCRLPTEAEWEYACRAGTTTPFSTGNNLTTSQANYNGNYPYNNNPKGEYREKTTLVGSFAPNKWGLYDMHGNVWEWCSDWYGDYSTSAQTNPKGASSGSHRVIRGGSWIINAPSCRAADRYGITPDYRSYNIGFRLVSPK